MRRVTGTEKEFRRAEVLIGAEQAGPGHARIERCAELDHAAGILHVDQRGEPDLPQVVQALDLFRLGLGPTQGGQQHARQDRDDGDDDQKLDEGEGANQTACRGWPAGRFSIPPFVRI